MRLQDRVSKRIELINKNESTAVSLRMSKELFDELKHRAEENGIKTSTLIRIVLEEYAKGE